MNNGIWFWALLCILSAALIVFWNNRRTRKIMDAIERMLDAAIEGDFVENRFDESCMSALESKFSRYLSASAVSARNVAMEKDKIKSLIADISHQSKIPVSNLLLYSGLLEEEELTAEARSNVETLREQTEKLRFLIDSLVKLSRLESGILTLSCRREPLSPMLQSVYEQFSSRAEEKGLEFHLQDTAAVANHDSKWTAEALCNIVDNAIKYTERGNVTISVKDYEMFVRIDITDSGIGIAEGEQGKIFARFYRSEDVRDKEGVGIGLYLAREIIANEGGYIKVSSVRGKGTVFSVFLPR